MVHLPSRETWEAPCLDRPWATLADFSHAEALVGGKNNAAAAFGCHYVTILHSEGPKNPFFNFINFSI